MLNHVQAKNEIRNLFLSRFRDYVLNGIPNQDPVFPSLELTKLKSSKVYVPTIYWQKVETRRQNDNGEHFLHFAMQNTSENQKSFTGGRKSIVGTQYTTYGYVTVEVYFSKTAYQTIDEDRLTQLIKRCFIQRNIQGLWFRNSVIVDLPSEENHYRSNVLAEYEYDSVIT